jgi:hypothetical protein
VRDKSLALSWVLVVHACNPSYSGGAEIRRLFVQSQSGQVVGETQNTQHKKELVEWLKW